MRILFYLNSPTTYQLNFFENLKKKKEVFVLYKNNFSQNHKLKFKKKKWMFFLRRDNKLYIKTILKKINPNIIVIGGYKLNILDIYLNKKIKKFFWLERVNNKNIIKNLIRNVYIKIKLKKADGIFAIGKEASKFYKSFNSNVCNLPYSINVQKKIKNYQVPKFLFVGQMVERKGIKLILDTLKKLNTQEYKFTFVGDGPLRKDVINLSRQNKNIKYIKFKNELELNRIYMQNNILVLPSKYDGWGVVIIEAMARGMALLSSDNVGASKEYIKHNFNGRIFNLKKNNFENQINYYIKNTNKIKLFGNRNIKIFKNNLSNSDKASNKIISFIKNF
jgi:glycosyltransferase involved in cell wall biosynthesis